ncbi:hypothetical protein PN36_34125 [Candidatus Thiomargarita nelsonii]|uniref:Filamentation induced by cAMP protein Fic-like C-terminal domain-containing protein n=1 Tax=Candidatus Thiomargarita nelsonii TaxID=1003181 RepID=A0A0A6PR70_9GAMM|nr:hypothetical protein PN36_34125 [Candidatus Thiomargarita nelsonii]
MLQEEVALTDQVTDQVKRLLGLLNAGQALKVTEMMARLNLNHRQTFRTNYLKPALAAKLVEMTQPDSPRSPQQKYRLTPKGETENQIKKDEQYNTRASLHSSP